MDIQITPIFSGGVGRSGTTLIGRILRQHSDVFGGSPNEVKFITEAYGLIDLTLGTRSFLPTQISRRGHIFSSLPIHRLNRVRFSIFRKRILGSWWRRTNRLGFESGLNRSMSKRQMSELLDQLGANLENPLAAARGFVNGFVTNHRKWQGEKYWIDTTPANMMYADYIYQIFPEARFIEMRREPLDNIASVLKEPWGPNDTKTVIPWFRDRIQLATEAKRKIPQNQHLTLFLEDLVANKRSASYQELLKITGLSNQSGMEDYFEREITAERAHIGRGESEIKDASNFQIKLDAALK